VFEPEEGAQADHHVQPTHFSPGSFDRRGRDQAGRFYRHVAALNHTLLVVLRELKKGFSSRSGRAGVSHE